jgi:hypothetical protein
MEEKQMHKSLRFLSVALCLFALSGIAASQKDQPAGKQEKPVANKPCGDKEIKPGSEKGKQERFFAFSPDKVKVAITDAMKSLEFDIKKDKDNQLEGQRKRHMGVFVGSGGEKLEVQFGEAEEAGTRGTRVTAETKKTLMGRVGQKSWAAAVLDEAECNLKGSKP